MYQVEQFEPIVSGYRLDGHQGHWMLVAWGPLINLYGLEVGRFRTVEAGIAARTLCEEQHPPRAKWASIAAQGRREYADETRPLSVYTTYNGD